MRPVTVKPTTTERVVEVLALVYEAMAACVAVIVVEPIAPSVTRPVLGSTVATDVLELLYVMAPLLLVAGAVNVNGAVPKVFVMGDIAPIIGSSNTVRVVVTVAEL